MTQTPNARMTPERKAELRDRLATSAPVAYSEFEELFAELDAVTRERDEDAARLQWLDARVRAETPWRDTVIMFDREDGMWLAEAERGDIRARALDHRSGPCRDLREAIDAARKRP